MDEPQPAVGDEPQGYEAPVGTPAGIMGASDMTSGWPEPSRMAADSMKAKYGEPDLAGERMLVWYDAGPWKKIVLSRDPVQHNFPMPHPDVLEQVINYEVPADKFDELAMYDGSVIAERTKGTLSARCDKEPANFLALNLANDVVKGTKTVEEARTYYARAIKEFMQGQKDPYTQGLQFELPRANVGDPDQPAGM